MRQAGLGEYLASLPYQFGYELDNHVVILGLRDSRPALSAAYEWNEHRDLVEQSEAFVAGFDRPMRKENVDSLLIIGYGPAGEQRARSVADAVEASSTTPPRVGTLEVEGGHYRHISPTASSRIKLPEPMPEVIVEGKVGPEVSPAALEATHAPLTEPAYPTVDQQTAARLDDFPPSVRADVARRYLDQLSDYHLAADRRGELQSTLAYLTHSNAHVRDAVLVDSLGDRAKAEALVALYRGAPDAYRASIVPVAALSNYVAQDGGTRRALAILEHGDSKNELGKLAETVVRGGIPPRDVHEALGAHSPAAYLEAADKEWHATRAAGVHSASFPARPGGRTTTPPHQAPDRRQHRPGKDASPER